MTNSIAELEDSDCILVVGSNTMEQHPLIAKRIIKAKEKGARLIVVDPRQIVLTDFADIHLQITPGTDIALANGLANVIIDEKMADEAFIAERTEEFDEFKTKVREYTPAKAAQITGVAEDDIREAARLYGRAERGSIVYCMGITQHVMGTNNVKSLSNLAMLTGNIGRQSTGVNPLRGQNNVQGACDMGGLPGVYSGYQAVGDGAAREKFEKAWKANLPATPGPTVPEMMDMAIEGKIKAMYIMGENPVLSDADRGHSEKALESVDFLVVQDIFLTETAQFADVVLPGTSYAEKEGTFTSTERTVSRVRQAIEPVGDSKPDWQIIAEIAKKLGSDQFNYQSPADIMDEIARLTPSYGGISYERLDRGERLAWPCPDAEHPGTPVLHASQFTRGKGKFFAVDHQTPAEATDEEYPFTFSTGRVIFQYHTGSMTRRTPALEHEAPDARLEINPRDAEKLSIKDGESITVKSRRGEIEVKAMVTDRILPGMVFLPFHYNEAAANVLTLDKRDPDAKIPSLKMCAASVSKRG